MTNKDKYLKEGVSVEELARKIDQYCYDNETPDEDTGLSDIDWVRIEELVAMFFEEETKPTLTEDERAILRNIDKIFEYIGRTKNGTLFLRIEMFSKTDDRAFHFYNHLFQFIKERRRI